MTDEPAIRPIAGPLRGPPARPPADKSISHRAALVGAMASEPVRIRNYLDAADTSSTLAAVRALGAIVERRRDELVIRGCGLRNARPPDRRIDVGNAGHADAAAARAGSPFQPGASFTLDGDESIRRRPVDRIAEPLRAMGARIEAREGRFPPFTVHGAPLHRHRVRAARGKRPGQVVRAARRARDRRHDGRSSRCRPATTPSGCSLRAGAPVHASAAAAAASARRSATSTSSSSTRSTVPGDPSSAAFLIAAGVLVPGSRPVLEASASTGRGPGFLRIARADGRDRARRPRAGRRVRRRRSRSPTSTSRTGRSRRTTVEPDEVPLAIDELPLVALLGCFAEGETVVRGAGELRVKESDRIATVVDGLRGLGADDRGDARRLRRARHRRPARRRASTPTATTGWRCSGRSPGWRRGRASRSWAWTPPPSPTRGFADDLARLLA